MSASVESSSSNEIMNKSPEEMKTEGFSQLSSGKRHLLVSNIPEAVSTLALACDLLSKQFGETHSECAEAYFYYGKSLLEMSRLESGVLGNALDGVPEDGGDGNSSQVEDPEKMTSDEKTRVESKVKEALDFNYKTCEVEADKAAEEAAAKEEEMEEGDEEGDDAIEDDSAADAPMEEEKEAVSTDDNAMDEEEPSNLQLSWEMFELAKFVYTKQIETAPEEKKVEVENKICETYLLLGEVSLENENYDQAVDDLTICLSRRLASLPSDSRSIAESHYQLGIAQAFNAKYEEAEVSLKSAIAVLEMRVTNLHKMEESSDNLKSEIVELQELVKDIEEKIDDHNSMKAEIAKKIKEGFTGNSESSSKPVSSISIKRKEEVSKVATDSANADTAAAAM